jgi:transposase InsO family protein
VGTRAPILVEAKPNTRWSLDFVHDQLAGGRRFRILNIVDDVTRECLAAIPDTSISGKRVARELTTIIAWRGKPRMIVSDNGTEFTSNAIMRWSKGINEIALHAPSKPMQNGYIRSFNGRTRQASRRAYSSISSGSANHHCLGCRLHHGEAAFVLIGYRTPAAFAIISQPAIAALPDRSARHPLTLERINCRGSGSPLVKFSGRSPDTTPWSFWPPRRGCRFVVIDLVLLPWQIQSSAW